MAKQCEICGESIDALTLFECSHCKRTFCSDHRLPESHNCPFSAVVSKPWKYRLDERSKYESTAHRGSTATEQQSRKPQRATSQTGTYRERSKQRSRQKKTYRKKSGSTHRSVTSATESEATISREEKMRHQRRLFLIAIILIVVVLLALELF